MNEKGWKKTGTECFTGHLEANGEREKEKSRREKKEGGGGGAALNKVFHFLSIPHLPHNPTEMDDEFRLLNWHESLCNPFFLFFLATTFAAPPQP
jgi:hypothetical protein